MGSHLSFFVSENLDAEHARSLPGLHSMSVGACVEIRSLAPCDRRAIIRTPDTFLLDVHS